MVDVTDGHEDVVGRLYASPFIRLSLSERLRSMFFLFFLILATRCSPFSSSSSSREER